MRERLINKWKKVLEISNIDKQYWGDISLYCENNTFDNIPISLRILSQIDLSKVEFTGNKKLCECNRIRVKLSRDDIHDLSFTTVDISSIVSSKMAENCVMTLNKTISDYGGVLIYNLGIIKNEINDEIIEMHSWFAGYNKIRIEKIKKLMKNYE